MSEAMNHVLSVRCPEPQPSISFILAIHEEVISQQEEVIRAFYGRGEWELCPEYKYLGVAEEVWFRASRQERLKYVQQVNNLSMEDLLSGKTVNFPKITVNVQSEDISATCSRRGGILTEMCSG